MVARALWWSGVTALLSGLPPQDQLVILNYHRIGNPEDDMFDPGVFSARADEFDAQISYLKRRVSLVTLEEAVAFVSGVEAGRSRRCRVLITFDDGYLDNYTLAYPVLRSHGAQGVFFLVTGMVGSSSVPWWDQIAFLVKTARVRRFNLRYPADLQVDLDHSGLVLSLRAILTHFKRKDNCDQMRFIRELAEQTRGETVPSGSRRFLDWNEALEMIKGGMSFGSHTHTHPVLTQLEPEQQRVELLRSKSILEQRLGTKAIALAYPVGSSTAFDSTTQRLAREAGYGIAFSYFGGVNLRERTKMYDVRRIGIDGQSWNRFRAQVAICRSVRKFWP